MRQIIGNDEKFRAILRGLNKDFRHQTITSEQVENYIIQKSGIDFSSVFDQYLRTIDIPVLEYYQKGKNFTFRWSNVVENFQMPIKLKSHYITITPNKEWQSIKLENNNDVEVDENYYIYTLKNN